MRKTVTFCWGACLDRCGLFTQSRRAFLHYVKTNFMVGYKADVRIMALQVSTLAKLFVCSCHANATRVVSISFLAFHCHL